MMIINVMNVVLHQLKANDIIVQYVQTTIHANNAQKRHNMNINWS